MMKIVQECGTKLLVVEEVPAMRRLIRSLLEGLELIVGECHDGRETLAACAAQQPDWVLLDLNLSDTDALVATRQIGVSHPHTKVLIVSDNDCLLLREAATEAGACGFMSKDDLLGLRSLLAEAKAISH